MRKAALGWLLCVPLLGAVGQVHASAIYKFTDANGVVNYTDRVTPGAKRLVFQDRMVESLAAQVRLDTRRVDGKVTYEARNDLYAPVQVELRLGAIGNAAGTLPRSIARTVPPRSSLVLATVLPAKVGKPITGRPEFRYALGDPSTSPRAYRYPFPWLGGPFRISQGANGRFSHTGPRGRYAIDIAMPEGTPIVAARAGTVIKVENSQGAGGAEASGNFVRVLHDDGTMSVYLHLMQGSVVVREGDKVAVGSPLARSGNTGNSTGPHLHFVVQRDTGLGLESIPYEFDRPLQSLPNFAVGNR
ncbi:peptidoglycan DD-metalloendopeptidase family protein [Pseudomonas japonica]|uniref:peptidoglycan DD-metalloendopeptidase family protein n=1 Tax=Pseudomonas japonica TaxID=256466 RepID=UPI0015E4345B|nr:M23 family metallopeptidase [Pseudomonas japonica]MBA1287990.1 M23 family metallopeptidase [Pseudomonas japonica]